MRCKKIPNNKIGRGDLGFDETDKKIVFELFTTKTKANDLFLKLAAFRNDIINVMKPEEFSDNPQFCKSLEEKKKEFEKSLVNYAGVDSTNKISTYFQNVNALEAVVMLDKIQNDILLDVNAMLNYFELQTSVYYDHYFDRFSAILSKNTNYLKAGDSLEIYAGIGSFSDAMRPTFIVNGTTVPVIDGRITYRLQAKGKPGKYNVPVTIKFTQPDGSLKTYNEKVDYTVIP